MIKIYFKQQVFLGAYTNRKWSVSQNDQNVYTVFILWDRNIKHIKYFHLTPNFWSIHYHGKRLHVHMFVIVYVDTAFSYGRALIVY